MFNLSADALSAFKTKLAKAQIRVDLVSGDAIPDLNEDDLKSLKIERAGVSGKSIEIGAARSFELNLELENGDGRFKGVNFDGAKLYLQTFIGAHTCPLGYFTVDGHENLTGSIQLTALDRMVLFDKSANLPSHIFPLTVKNLVLRACDYCGVDSSKLDFNSLCNAEYEVRNAPESEPSWRTIIIWACEILGACAFFDAEGYFRIRWYENTGLKITPSDRFTHKIFENDVVVRGVEIIDTDKQSYVAGEIDSGFYFSIEGNELLSHDYGDVAANLGARLIGFLHRPFTATTLTLPNIFPLDIMTYVDSDGNEYSVCVTSCDYTFNGNTALEGAGESEATSGFASMNPLTKQERAILAASLKKVTDDTRQEISEKQAALLRVNEIISNALGLYLIPVTNAADGSTQYYFANKPTLEESSLIYVFNAGGFAWANKWGGSNKNTVWNYGITSEGNAVLNYLTVNKLTADHISVEKIVGAINASTGEQLLQIEADHLNINGVISANGTFSVDESGYITATGGEIAGLEMVRQVETDGDNNTVEIVKQLRNKTDSFHIKVTEDADGKAKETEVLITNLLCDYIKANNSSNLIDLCYQGKVEEITATLSYGSSFDLTITGTPNGLNWIRRTVTINITLSGTVLTPKKVTVAWGIQGVNVYADCSYTANITIPKGTSGVYTYSTTYFNTYGLNVPVNFAYFVETNGNTLKFTTAEETDTMLAIRGNTIPLETDTYGFGHEDKRWKGGYFETVYADNLKLGGVNAAAPQANDDRPSDYYLYESSGDTISGSTFSKTGETKVSETSSFWTVVKYQNIKLGDMIITVASYNGELKNDRWYRFTTPKNGRIVSVQVTPWGGDTGESLSGNTHAGSLCVRWDTSANTSTVYIGCDTNSCAQGFICTIISIPI